MTSPDRDPTAEAAPPSLDEAWRRAEAALPEGWVVNVGAGYGELGPDHRYLAGAKKRGSQGGIGWSGPTPAAALIALSEKLEAHRG